MNILLFLHANTHIHTYVIRICVRTMHIYYTYRYIHYAHILVCFTQVSQKRFLGYIFGFNTCALNNKKKKHLSNILLNILE